MITCVACTFWFFSWTMHGAHDHFNDIYARYFLTYSNNFSRLKRQFINIYFFLKIFFNLPTYLLVLKSILKLEANENLQYMQLENNAMMTINIVPRLFNNY